MSAVSFTINIMQLEYEQWRLLATFLTEVSRSTLFRYSSNGHRVMWGLYYQEASSRLYGVLVFPGGWMSGHSEVSKSVSWSSLMVCMNRCKL